MIQENICQFYIIIGDKDFRPLNTKDAYINATGILDNNLIKKDIWEKFEEKKGKNINSKIIFLIPSNDFKYRCEEIANALNIDYEIKFISKYISENEKSQKLNNVKKVETELMNDKNITASGSENIEVQKDTGIQKITISDNKAYVNSEALSIDRQKYLLLQEWKKDPYISSKLVGLSSEEIDRMLMESVTMNLTSYRMESSREQNAYDKVGEVAKNKSSMEDGLYNSELRIVRNNVSNENKYSTVEESNGKTQIINHNVSSSIINSGGVINNFGGRTEEDIINKDMQARGDLGEYYLDEQYNIYNSEGNVIGRVGQNGIWVDSSTNTLVMNGRLVGYVGDYKDMGKSSDSLNKNNVRVKKKDENKSVAFVSLPGIMFILSAMLLVGSVILLFVLE